MTALDEYIGRAIDIITTNRSDERQMVLLIRKLTQEALARESFLLACADKITASIDSLSERWRNPPLYSTPDPAVTIRVFYWPPGYQNSPHLHSTWTVTGVLHNEIVAQTFKGATSADPSALGTPTAFTAHAGDTGYLLPPCVHYLHNASQVDTATFHVFSTDDQYRNSDAESPRRRVTGQAAGLPTNVRRRALRVLAAMLARVREHSAVELLLKIYALGDPPVKLQAVKALLSHDVRLAAEKSRALEASLRGRDRDMLSRINAALAAG